MVIILKELNILNILKEQKKLKLKGNIYHITQIQFAYNTNHIEGSTLTEEQTRLMYETNSLLTESDKASNLDDIIEMNNHFKLFDYMIDTAEHKLTENLIKKYHKILKSSTSFERIDWFNIGEYKAIPNEVSGNKTTEPKNVSAQMNDLLNWYNNLSIISFKDIIEFHYKFESILPFQDGNGRIGRIIIFKECLKNNITPFIVLDEYKAFYYRGLKEYKTENGYLIDTCLNMQDKYSELINKLI